MSVQSPTQPAAGKYFAGLRWCVELYCFSTCMNFRLVTGAKNHPFVRPEQNLSNLISFLALGWARHIAKQQTAEPATPSASTHPEAARNMRSVDAVLKRCDAWRLSHVELRTGGLLWPRGPIGPKPPRNVAAVREKGAVSAVAAGLAVDSCTPLRLAENQHLQGACILQQCGADSAVQHPDNKGFEVENVPYMPQNTLATSEQENGAGGRQQGAPVLLLAPAYGNESNVEGEWVELHDACHDGVWREEAEGGSERCTWSQVSPMYFHNSRVCFEMQIFSLMFRTATSCMLLAWYVF